MTVRWIQAIRTVSILKIRLMIETTTFRLGFLIMRVELLTIEIAQFQSITAQLVKV